MGIPSTGYPAAVQNSELSSNSSKIRNLSEKNTERIFQVPKARRKLKTRTIGTFADGAAALGKYGSRQGLRCGA